MPALRDVYAVYSELRPPDSQVQRGITKVVFPKKLKGNIEALVKGLCNAIPSALAKEPSKSF